MNAAPKILAFAASSSSASINRHLVEHAAARLQSLAPAVEVEFLDLRDYELPVYSIDRERTDGIPQAAQRFFEKIGNADGLLISYAEHNGFYTAAFKNVFDWASRVQMKVFQGKPMVAMATSPGPRGGTNVLRAALDSAPHFGAEVVGSLSVPKFSENFDLEAGTLRDRSASVRLGMVLQRFAARLGIEAGPANPFGAEMWDTRYAEAQVAYGADPNVFLRAVAGRIPPGPVLVLAAGEGRDAVFLAERGHDVTAIDLSAVGLEHAQQLAEERGVALRTVVGDAGEFDFGQRPWAGIVAVWAHMPPEVRKKVHAASVRALQPGGAFVLEAYSPKHLHSPGHGGPPFADMMMTPQSLRTELEGLEFELVQEVSRDVQEGRDHSGASTTTQVLAFKP